MSGPGSVTTAPFSSDGSSAGGARRFVAASLDAWGLGALEEVACLLVSELVSNVVLHAGTELDVHLLRSGTRVRVEVHDGSQQLPERKYYSHTATTGRGLLFIAELAQSWGTDPRDDGSGKAVWFELDESATAAPPTPAVSGELNLDDWEDCDDLTPAGAPDDPGPASAPTPGATGSSRRALLLHSGPT